MTRTDHVYWQAHRGGGAYEAPDNTMAANRYAWKLGGIPEADIRTTGDGVIICLHDSTPARTTNAPEGVGHLPISEFTFEATQAWDAGVKFDGKFRGEKIPSLRQLFEEMRGRPERLVYLDLKQVALRQLGELIDEYDVHGQVIFTHHKQENCKTMKKIAVGVRTMLWIGGSPERIMETYHEARGSGFEGLDQVQFHVHSVKDGSEAWRFQLSEAFLREALMETAAAGIDLEAFPFSFDQPSMDLLLQAGIRWYATDEPARFLACVENWKNRQ